MLVEQGEDIEAVAQAGAIRQSHAVGAQRHLDIKCHAIAVVDRIGIALPGRLVATLPCIQHPAVGPQHHPVAALILHPGRVGHEGVEQILVIHVTIFDGRLVAVAQIVGLPLHHIGEDVVGVLPGPAAIAAPVVGIAGGGIMHIQALGLQVVPQLVIVQPTGRADAAGRVPGVTAAADPAMGILVVVGVLDDSAGMQ
ncbi:hypothetical protein D3C71_978690 [compost metagenome]